ncbi:hypothetical protein JCGZ_19804 [Jatropha curcas]|uniref:Uncharacterized protein n=1 Tax=Jatropha curcas TaxID=180498 RepID=A0A067JXB1_JATCU|nr:hypothetical protein JCGZ_19804 [Jatropha curcas]
MPTCASTSARSPSPPPLLFPTTEDKRRASSPSPPRCSESRLTFPSLFSLWRTQEVQESRDILRSEDRVEPPPARFSGGVNSALSRKKIRSLFFTLSFPFRLAQRTKKLRSQRVVGKVAFKTLVPETLVTRLEVGKNLIFDY